MPKTAVFDADTFILHQVVTLPEALKLWGKSRRALENALDTSTGKESDDLIYRRSGASTLISVASLIRRWGPPRGLIT